MTKHIEAVEILTGHVDQETARLVDDYPYGRTLRCSIRYWVETASKGAKKGQQRVVSQTTNPKAAGEPWNKPHPGQYSRMAFLYVENDTGYIMWTGVSELGVTPESDARLRLMGVYQQMSDEQRSLYDTLVATSRRYADPWDDWAAKIESIAAHIRDTGQDPAVDNGRLVWPGGHAYIGTFSDGAVHLTAARTLVRDGLLINDHRRPAGQETR